MSTVRSIPILFLFAITLVLFSPERAEAFIINSHVADIEVHTDGTFTVVEDIVYDFRENERHGIYREIPTSHPQPGRSWLTERYVEIDFTEVLMDDESVPYAILDTRGLSGVQIGDPNKTVTGEHRYTITYTVRGGLSYFAEEGVTEISWNTTGLDWSVRILEAHARITAPEDILLRTRSCYYGSFGEDRSCVIDADRDDNPTFHAYDLWPREGLTISQALDRDAVEVLILERYKPIPLYAGALILWLLALVYFVFRYKTRHKQHRTIVTQFKPYEDLKPMLSGYLRDGTLGPQDLTAGILYLASEGFIKMHATKKDVLFFSLDDHEVTLLRPMNEATGTFDRDLLSLMFNEHDAIGTKVSLRDLRSNTARATKNFSTLTRIKKEALEDLTKRGFYEEKPKHYFTILTICIFATIAVVGGGIILEQLMLLLAIPFALSATVAWGFMVPRKSKKGYDAVNHLQGFERYLSVTGKDRYAFHSAPDKNPQTFLEYLPFAIAFGVEDKWAKVFDGVTIPNPEWYDGTTTTHFDATSFADGIGAFSTSFTTASGSARSSSSGGGGSSGGGAGGGGGGSW